MTKTSALALLSSKPLFALGYCDKVVPANTPNLKDVKSWRASEAAYSNTTCARTGCKLPKNLASETIWCATCAALPTCSDCGDCTEDCYCDDSEAACRGCEDGCSECDEDLKRYPRSRGYRGYDAPYTP